MILNPKTKLSLIGIAFLGVIIILATNWKSISSVFSKTQNDLPVLTEQKNQAVDESVVPAQNQTNNQPQEKLPEIAAPVAGPGDILISGVKEGDRILAGTKLKITVIAGSNIHFLMFGARVVANPERVDSDKEARYLDLKDSINGGQFTFEFTVPLDTLGGGSIFASGGDGHGSTPGKNIGVKFTVYTNAKPVEFFDVSDSAIVPIDDPTSESRSDIPLTIYALFDDKMVRPIPASFLTLTVKDPSIISAVADGDQYSTQYTSVVVKGLMFGKTILTVKYQNLTKDISIQVYGPGHPIE